MPKQTKKRLIKSSRYRKFKKYLNKDSSKKKKIYKLKKLGEAVSLIGAQMKFNTNHISNVIKKFEQNEL